MALTSRKAYTVNEVLAQLQDMASEESGDEPAEEQIESSEEEVMVTEDSSSSTDSSSDDTQLEPLQKRLKIADDAAILQPATRGRSAQAGRGRAERERNHAEVIRDGSNSDDDDAQVATAAKILPGKNGTKWTKIAQKKMCAPRQLQNIIRLAPGPKQYAMEQINSATAALKLMLDITMITWIVKFTQMEAER